MQTYGPFSTCGGRTCWSAIRPWFLATDPGILFYETAVFNGWLYLGTLDAIKGYSVMKTRAEGAPPYQLTTVIPPGAYLPDFPSKSVVSMTGTDIHC